MQTYHVNTHITSDGELHLLKLPYKPGQEVEVVVRPFPDSDAQEDAAWMRMGLENFFEDDAEGDSAYDLL